MYTAERISLDSALTSVLTRPTDWSRRFDVEYYVDLCEMAGFCKTDDQRRLCAERYLAGKRKVSPPGTSRRKKAAAAVNKLLRHPPETLTNAVEVACSSPVASQYLAGNHKVLNSLIGMVMKTYKTEPSAVRELILRRLV